MSSIAELLTRQTASFVTDFPGNLYLVDKNLIIYACSNLMARTFGYSSGQDVVGLSVLEFPTSHLAPEVVLDCKNVFETGEIVRGERDCLDCHGNDIAYSTQKVPLKDEQGNTYALLAIALDITTQKKVEKETRLKEKNFKDILSIVPALVYWKDLKSDYLGSNDQDLIPVGVNDFQIMPWAEHAQTYRDQDALVIKTNTTHTFEDSRIDANGTKDFFLSKKQPLKNEEGETIGIIGVTINVTAQKEVERLELEKLEKKLELQDTFRKVVMQANHDIGSPLLVLDLFAHKYLESAPEEQRNSVRNSIQRIRAIAFSMLHRFTENNSEKSDTLLFPLLFEVINEKQLEYPNTPIRLATEQESPVCFAFFNADPQAFKRMISNVVNNSIDALTDTPEPFIKIDVSKIQDKIIVTISDNGCGMPESVKNKILANVAVSEGKKSGHGIGYVQIREMLNLHNANLEIESSKEQGTKVTITFPALKNLDYIPQSLVFHPSDIIVVVDDDPSVHLAWDLRFSEIAHTQVKHFTQGKKALQYIRSHPENLKSDIYLLTDYELLNQDINGIDLINQLNLKRSLLVTSHYLNKELISEVRTRKIKMLPKILAAKIPVRVLA